MPSIAWQNWSTDRARSLDEIEQAHAAVGGIGPGRRYATLQVNHAYAVLLASQFQGFCRDLHTECGDAIVAVIPQANLKPLVRKNLILHRMLGRGNATPSNIGADFNRFDISFWPEVHAHDPSTLGMMKHLESLNDWRNAIAHQDFANVGGNSALQLQMVKKWRKACHKLATVFDTVMQSYLHRLSGVAPW